MNEELPIISEPNGILEKLEWRLLGKRHVNEHYVQVVYRDRAFCRFAGPGYYQLNLGEEAGKPISLGLRFDKLLFSGLATRELVPVDLIVSVSYRFDPRRILVTEKKEREASRELASYMINAEKYLSKILEGRILPPLRIMVGELSVAEVQAALVLTEVNKQLLAVLLADQGLPRMGIFANNVEVEDRRIPDEIKKQYIESQSARIVRGDLHDGGLETIAAAMLRYLDKVGANSSSSYVSTSGLAGQIRDLIDGAPLPREVVDSTATPKPSLVLTPESASVYQVSPRSTQSARSPAAGSYSEPTPSVSSEEVPAHKKDSSKKGPTKRPSLEEPDPDSYGDY